MKQKNKNVIYTLLMLGLFVISCSRVETNYPSLFIDNSNEVKFAAFAESYSGLPAEDGIKKLTNMKYDIYSFTRDGKVVFYRAAYTVKGELVKSSFDDDKKVYYTANYTMIGDTIKPIFKGEESFFAGGVLRLIKVVSDKLCHSSFSHHLIARGTP